MWRVAKLYITVSKGETDLEMPDPKSDQNDVLDLPDVSAE